MHFYFINILLSYKGQEGKNYETSSAYLNLPNNKILLKNLDPVLFSAHVVL